MARSCSCRVWGVAEGASTWAQGGSRLPRMGLYGLAGAWAEV
ncbi:MAG: hypothetical protein ABF436_09850 [Acetobacter okinawensis]